MKDPIFILGAHKAGTSLLRALLDNHPQLSVLPVESHPFQHLHYGIDYPFRFQRPGSLSREAWLSNVRRCIETYNEKDDYQADAAMAGKLDLEAFEGVLRDADSRNLFGRMDLREWIETYFLAIQAGSGFEPEKTTGRRFVEKSVEHFEFAWDLSAMFPDAQFLHIVRNPYANLVAIRKYKGKKRFPKLRSAIKALKANFYWLERNQRLLSNYQVLRYEDLVQAPRANMATVASSLGLEWQDSLLEPTSLGAPWSGNSTTNHAFQGVSSNSLTSWRGGIHPLEADLVNRHLAEVLDRFGYAKETPASSIWQLGPKESPGVYLRNRLLLSEHPAAV